MSREPLGTSVERFLSQEQPAIEILHQGQYDLSLFDAEVTTAELQNRVPKNQVSHVQEQYTNLMQAALRRTLYAYLTKEGEETFATQYLKDLGVGIDSDKEAKRYLESARTELLTTDINPLDDDEDRIAGRDSGVLLDLMDAIVKRQEDGLAFIKEQVKDLKPILLEQAIQAQELEKEKYRDSMTGLYNKEGVKRMYQTELTKLQQEEKLMVVMFDINSFKHINDSLGHETGDTVLQKLATKLSNGLRSTDVIARTGGDEFVLLINTPTQGVPALQAKLAEIINGVTYRDTGGTTEHITVSAGITLVSSGERPAYEESLGKSDFAASISKLQQGSDTLDHTMVIYNDDLKSDIRRRLDNSDTIKEFATNVVVRRNKRMVDSLKRRKEEAVAAGAPQGVIETFDDIISRQREKLSELVENELLEISLAQAGYGKELYAQIYS